IRSGDYDDEDIKEAILQVCSEIDKPDTPAAEARKAFYRKIIGLSDEARRRFKKQLLALTRDQVMEAAKKYFGPSSGKKAVAVISGEEKLNEENKKLLDNPLKLYRI
ncbi:MAG: peptidase M16, partial [Deltaproteobacteria bacterium]|nr:peptidase M16 [Deltaproteobacteria bacterium]